LRLRQVRYRMASAPLFVHCCHCRWCQRESGSAFALNAMIHVFTASRQPWVVLPDGTPAVPGYYEREAYWPPPSLARWQAILPRVLAWRAARPPLGA
jgi:hypothetical protein